MSSAFFEKPILNSPYAYPGRHWELQGGHGEDDLLNLIVEIKGYRGEDAKEKKPTMETYWIPGVSRLGTFGRWAFVEFTDVWEIEKDFAALMKKAFAGMLAAVAVEGQPS